jgi:hypothetical protein
VLTVLLGTPSDVPAVDGDAGQDVGLVLVAQQFAQRGVVALPVGRPRRVPVRVDLLERGLLSRFNVSARPMFCNGGRLRLPAAVAERVG